MPLGRRRERRLLALLLLEPGHGITVPRLVSLLRLHEPPADPLASLKGHASRLRAVLRPEAGFLCGDGR